MGKTGLIWHCFSQKEIAEHYLTFMVDIYSTNDLADFVFRLGKEIVSRLRPWGQSAIDRFLQVVGSLRTGISFDGLGNASWNLEVGDIKAPEFTLDEIFSYLGSADSPCIVAIDEFQTITKYPEKNVEALLRTYVQQCRNAVFLFAGSHRTIMNEIFASPARPFYQSITMMNLGVINDVSYVEFAQQQFRKYGKEIEAQVVDDIYRRFDGTTWYMQKMLNELFMLTGVGECCTGEQVDIALTNILHQNDDTYRDMLFLLSAKQVALLKAICKAVKATKITSGEFITRHKLTSASSVQKGVKALLALQMITATRGCYEVYDKFLAVWLARQYGWGGD